MTTTFCRFLSLTALSSLCLACSYEPTAPMTQTPVQAVAPVGPGAYPSFGSCSSGTVPGFPPGWSANVLLTPFQEQPLQVARVSAKSVGSQKMMVVTTDTVPPSGPVGWFIQGSEVYRLSDGASGLQCQAVTNPPRNPAFYKTPWDAPATDFLAQTNCNCMGSNVVAGVESEAWRCENGQTNSSGDPEYDWFWFSKDNDRFPRRFLLSRENNHEKLPVLGDNSLVHFTGFSTKLDLLLGDASNVCNNIGTAQAKLPSPAIAGVSYDSANPPTPPIWPNTAFANGALFAVGGSYTAMAIYYDYNSLNEVSKIKSPGGSITDIQDTRLTKGITYEIGYQANGDRVCQGTLVNVGIWRPDWATHDQCHYKATIAASSALNPLGEALQAMSCYFGGTGNEQSNIQAWYTLAGEPKMFYETNAGDLDLIDYYAWMPNATIPAGVLYPISSCAGGAQTFTQCNACHGKK